MADLSDVEQAITALITRIIYPSGVSSGPVASVGGVLVDIRRGWPLPSALDIALASGNDVLVRIYPEGGMTRNTSRFVLEWRDPLIPVVPTLTASVAGPVVTYGGTGSQSQVTGVMVGTPPYGIAYAYRLNAGDGPAEVVLALQALIGGGTSAIGNVLTLLTNRPVLARVVTDQNEFMETRRQDQGIRVSIWSANNVARDAVANLIDNALANLLDINGNPTMNVVLADGSAAWLRYRSTYDLDVAEKAGLYRRDLCYLCEYPTSLVQSFGEVLFGVGVLTIYREPPADVPQVVISSSTLTV